MPSQTSDTTQSDAVEEQMPRNEAELLAEASRGDQSAFTDLYHMYESDLYRFAFYLAESPETADELFQVMNRLASLKFCTISRPNCISLVICSSRPRFIPKR